MSIDSARAATCKEVIAMPSRKIEELAMYERLYSKREAFASSEIREGLLQESESCFRNLIAKFASNLAVLEIGCGDGLHAIHAARSGALRVIGIDISPAGISRANERLSAESPRFPVVFEEMDIEDLGYSDSSFGLIIDHETFSSIKLQNAISELARVLEPGGRLIAMECLGHNPIFNLNRAVKKILGKRTAWAASNIFQRRHLELLSQHFEIEEIKFFHLLTVLFAPFRRLPGGSHIIEIAKIFDSKLLTLGPLKFLAFKCVLVLRRRSTS